VRNIRNTQIHCVGRLLEISFVICAAITKVDYTGRVTVQCRWTRASGWRQVCTCSEGKERKGWCTWKRKQDSTTNRCQLSGGGGIRCKRNFFPFVNVRKSDTRVILHSASTPDVLGNFSAKPVRQGTITLRRQNTWDTKTNSVALSPQAVKVK
jgi:hypothetical protein